MPPSSSSSPTPAAARTPPSWRIWYAILAAPIAFGLEESLGWLIANGSCPVGSPAGTGGTVLVGDARSVLIGVGAGALVASLIALWIGILEFRASADRSIASIHAHGRGDYLAAIALLVSFVFTLGVLLESVAMFVLPTCEIMR